MDEIKCLGTTFNKKKWSINFELINRYRDSFTTVSQTLRLVLMQNLYLCNNFH